MKPSLQLTNDTWAVSMVVENVPFSLHTMLLIETIQESGRVNFKAHLTSPIMIENNRIKVVGSFWSTAGKVSFKKLPTVISTKPYRPNYETWTISREQVQRMLDQISEEQEQPETLSPFHMLGEKSIFTPSYVDLEIQDSRLREMQEKEPKKFNELLALHQELMAEEEVVADMDESEREQFVPMKYPLLKYLSITMHNHENLEKAASKEKGVMKGVFNISAFFSACTAVPIICLAALPAFTIDGSRMWLREKKVEKNKEILELFTTQVRIKKVVSQNCFNWARNKLSMVGVDIPEKSCEWLTTIPTMYLPKQH